MIERCRHGEAVQGIAPYLRDAGGIRLDHDEVFGTLWRGFVTGDEPLVMVGVSITHRTPTAPTSTTSCASIPTNRS
jgi:hypothetical protein